MENSLQEVDEDSDRANVPPIVGPKSETSSETNTFNRDRKKNKKSVNFEPSKEASLDLDNILRERYTPETDLFDYSPDIFDERSLIPDFKILCKVCKIHLNLSEINDHKQFHEALTTLGLKHLPENENGLWERRAQLVKSTQSKFLKKSKDFETNKVIDWNVKVKRINNAYELISSYVNNTFEQNRRLNNADCIKLDSFGEGIVSLNELIVGVGSCTNQNKKYRKNMEDRNIVLENFGENQNLTYIGVFDGYDGEVASDKCSHQLHQAALSYLSKNNIEISYSNEQYSDDEINHLNKYEKQEEREAAAAEQEATDTPDKEPTRNECFQRSFKYAYRQMDKLLSRGRDETSQKRWSGASTCTCIIENRKSESSRVPSEGWLHIANCGDVEAIAILDTTSTPNSKHKYKVLTSLHTLNAFEKDYDRIKRRGGKVFETANGVRKLQGLYDITRALGFYGDKNIKCFIKATPTVESFKIEPNFLCVIIATKGLWGTLSHEKVADLVLEILPSKNNLLNRTDLNISPSVKAMVSQYYQNQSRLHTKMKSNLTISSEKQGRATHETLAEISENEIVNEPVNDRQDEANTEADEKEEDQEEKRSEDKGDDDDVIVSRKNSATTMNSQLGDDSLSNYIKSSFNKGPQFYSENRCNSAFERVKEGFGENAEGSNNIGKHKTNSDIYPIMTKNHLMNQFHDKELYINELSSFQVEYKKPAWQSKSSFDVEHNFDGNYDSMYDPYIHKPDLEVVETEWKNTQVTEKDLELNERIFMENRNEVKRLEISEMLAEKLVTCALVAGSTDNITVNCVLFAGTNI